VHTAHTLETKNILMSREAYESGTERKNISYTDRKKKNRD